MERRDESEGYAGPGDERGPARNREERLLKFDFGYGAGEVNFLNLGFSVHIGRINRGVLKFLVSAFHGGVRRHRLAAVHFRKFDRGAIDGNVILSRLQGKRSRLGGCVQRNLKAFGAGEGHAENRECNRKFMFHTCEMCSFE